MKSRSPELGGRAKLSGMEGYVAKTYGERIAPIYDQRYPSAFPAQVDLLAELAGTGPALELGIGTGRLALPLAARGGPRDRRLPRHGGTPAGQARRGRGDSGHRGLRRAVARHLTPGGRFLVEAFVPDLGRFDRGQRVCATTVGLDLVELDCSVHDPVAQRVTTQHVTVGPSGILCYPVEIRYAWPSELDLMASLAGLEPEARWGGWDRRRFGSDCGTHLSLWRSPAGHQALRPPSSGTGAP